MKEYTKIHKRKEYNPNHRKGIQSLITKRPSYYAYEKALNLVISQNSSLDFSTPLKFYYSTQSKPTHKTIMKLAYHGALLFSRRENSKAPPPAEPYHLCSKPNIHLMT